MSFNELFAIIGIDPALNNDKWAFLLGLGNKPFFLWALLERMI